MKNFELWLDESGDFNNDQNKTRSDANPSLIGGLLIENRTFPDSYVNSILPEDGTYHSVNENDQLVRFRKIEEKLFKNAFNRFVVFSNQERIMILDNNLTYLNVISEGILQLIKHLKAQYGEIYLRIVIANRVDTTTGQRPENSVVSSNEYIKRVKEKLLVGGFDNSISSKEWELQTASARKDKRLMLADIVCNTFFTRYRERKFNVNERNYIEGIYDDSQKTIVFTVFESLLEKEFNNNILENRIGEAVSIICVTDDKELLKKGFRILGEKIRSCGFYDIRFQYKFIEAYIEYYINVVRDFDVCELLLCNLLKYYIPLLEKYDSSSSSNLSEFLALDIKFYLLTVYTHTGNIEKSKRIEKECEKEMNNLPASIDSLNYQIRFKGRRVNSLINEFAFEDALSRVDILVDNCREIKDMLSLVSDDDRIYYDELAKALGTRLQIKTFLLRSDDSIYASAVTDSEQAIKNFVRDEDIKRQYLYRVQLETEHKAYDNALEYLIRSLDYKDTDFKKMWSTAVQASIFSVSAYIRLMAEGAAHGWSKSNDMFDGMSNDIFLETLRGKDKLFHPVEIVFWKYAKFCSCNGMINAAQKYYESSVDVCFADNDITLNVIGIGIECEYHSFLLMNKKNDVTSHIRTFRKKWERTKKIDKTNIIEKVFGIIDFQSKDPELYLELSRKVTY